MHTLQSGENLIRGICVARTIDPVELAPYVRVSAYLGVLGINMENGVYEFSPAQLDNPKLKVEADIFVTEVDQFLLATLTNKSDDVLCVDANEILGTLDPMSGDEATRYIAYHEFLPKETEDKPFRSYFDLDQVPT